MKGDRFWVIRVVENYGFFFFSSRRRHTRSLCDWSSDVCSSDLGQRPHAASPTGPAPHAESQGAGRSEERRVGKGVDLGGRRIIKKKKKKNNTTGMQHTKEGQLPPQNARGTNTN